MELGLTLEGLLYAILWLILPRYDPYFSETAYFAEMFTASVVVALAAFLAIDRLQSKSIQPKPGLPATGLQGPN